MLKDGWVLVITVPTCLVLSCDLFCFTPWFGPFDWGCSAFTPLVCSTSWTSRLDPAFSLSESLLLDFASMW